MKHIIQCYVRYNNEVFLKFGHCYILLSIILRKMCQLYRFILALILKIGTYSP
jgi:hypothetical protein